VKLFKIFEWKFCYSYSLYGPRGLTEEEKRIYASIEKYGFDMALEVLRNRGYDPRIAALIVSAMANHYFYDLAIVDPFRLRKLVYWNVQQTIPSKILPTDPTGMSPQSWGYIYTAVLVGLMFSVAMLAGAEFKDPYSYEPPCPAYVGVHKEKLWFLELTGVSFKGVKYYELRRYCGRVIFSHLQRVYWRNGEVDRLTFGGTMVESVRKWGFYNHYYWGSVYLDYVGQLERQSSFCYTLKAGDKDRWAPKGPIAIPESERCRKWLPY